MTWCAGTVTAYDAETGKHEVRYDDGDVRCVPAVPAATVLAAGVGPFSCATDIWDGSVCVYRCYDLSHQDWRWEQKCVHWRRGGKTDHPN